MFLIETYCTKMGFGKGRDICFFFFSFFFFGFLIGGTGNMYVLCVFVLKL